MHSAAMILRWCFFLGWSANYRHHNFSTIFAYWWDPKNTKRRFIAQHWTYSKIFLTKRIIEAMETKSSFVAMLLETNFIKNVFRWMTKSRLFLPPTYHSLTSTLRLSFWCQTLYFEFMRHLQTQTMQSRLIPHTPHAWLDKVNWKYSQSPKNHSV